MSDAQFTPLDADGNPSGQPIDIPNATGWRLTGPDGELIAESIPLNTGHYEAADEARERLYAAGELHLPDYEVDDDEDIDALAEAYHRITAAAEWTADNGYGTPAPPDALIDDVLTVVGMPIVGAGKSARVRTIREQAERTA